MRRIKTGGRGFEFSQHGWEITWDDTKAELEEESRCRREKSKSINPEQPEIEVFDNDDTE